MEKGNRACPTGDHCGAAPALAMAEPTAVTDRWVCQLFAGDGCGEPQKPWFTEPTL